MDSNSTRGTAKPGRAKLASYLVLEIADIFNICPFQTSTICTYSPPLILAWFIGYFTSRDENSQDSYHAVTPACVDICPPIVSLDEKHSRHKSFSFFVLLFYMEENQTRFVGSSDSDIKKLVANIVP